MRGLPQFIFRGSADRSDPPRGDSWVSVPGGAPECRAGDGLFRRIQRFRRRHRSRLFQRRSYRASEQAGLDLRFLQRSDKSPLLAIVHETHPPSYFFVGDDSARSAFRCLRHAGGVGKRRALGPFRLHQPRPGSRSASASSVWPNACTPVG